MRITQKIVFCFCFIWLLFINTNVLVAQYNLVPNPSFEIFDTCPNNLNQLRYAIPWTNPIYPGSTPDYYNACDTSNQWASVPFNQPGYELARTGFGYAFIITAQHTAPNFTNYREYIQVMLNDSLVGGEDYCIQFYVSACDSCLYISNNIGVYFSPTAIHDSITGYPFNLPLIPQFENPASNNLNSRNGWTAITGNYTASGGEKYIIIGNFRDSNNTIDQYTGWSHGHWAGYYIDDVLITPCDSLTGIEEEQLNPKIKIFPNPSSDLITIEDIPLGCESISIYNELGIEVETISLNKNSKTTLNISSFPQGIYSLVFKLKNSVITKKIIHIKM